MIDRPEVLILLVDDDEAKRYSVAKILLRAGFSVKEAATGSEALQLAALRPDLVILDVRLPDLDGFEVCRRIKSDPATRAIPVLHVSSTFVNIEDKIQGLESGADGYLTSVAEPLELVATVRALLRARRRGCRTPHVPAMANDLRRDQRRCPWGRRQTLSSLPGSATQSTRPPIGANAANVDGLLSARGFLARAALLGVPKIRLWFRLSSGAKRPRRSAGAGCGVAARWTESSPASTPGRRSDAPASGRRRFRPMSHICGLRRAFPSPRPPASQQTHPPRIRAAPRHPERLTFVTRLARFSALLHHDRSTFS